MNQMNHLMKNMLKYPHKKVLTEKLSDYFEFLKHKIPAHYDGVFD